MAFANELHDLYENRFINKQEIKKKEDKFIENLLKLEENALNEYYERCKTNARANANLNDLFCCYIYDDDKFNDVHQIMKQKFMEDGIIASESGRGPFVRGFNLKI